MLSQGVIGLESLRRPPLHDVPAVQLGSLDLLNSAASDNIVDPRELAAFSARRLELST